VQGVAALRDVAAAVLERSGSVSVIRGERVGPELLRGVQGAAEGEDAAGPAERPEPAR
jgi:uncharacterized membrane protein YcaP (DUF421 family)